METSFDLAVAVFFVALFATFGVAILGRLHSTGNGEEEELAGRGLNRWLVGLSAGATGNSGFIVTGAVGLGYVGGVQWIVLPIAWMIGDILFWKFFPSRLNQFSRATNAVTLSELLTAGLTGKSAKTLGVLVAALLVVFLTVYTAAQWLAGRKFLSTIFDLSAVEALLFFSTTIVFYSAIGRFRGSIYADTLQAVVRLVGTVIALIAVLMAAAGDRDYFNANIQEAGAPFLSILPGMSLPAAVGFIGGYAFAAIGFGLGQPQVVSRYFAGNSPEETRSAWWIYIGFVQFTWISMTLFGVLLRGVMPGIEDPETGMSVFFDGRVAPILTGIIFADVYATIASTSNSLLVAISQAVRRDILRPLRSVKLASSVTGFPTIFAIGLCSIALSLVLPGTVFSIALGAISKVGAAVAAPVMIKLLNWRHSGSSLLVAVLIGLSAAYAWEFLGFSTTFNEAGVGILCGLLANYAFYRVFSEARSSVAQAK